MQTFLDTVAADLYRKQNGDFSNVTLVFPNKRASLFFNNALERISEHPVWSPQYTTISELFREQSPLEIADRIMLVSELYQVYISVVSADNGDNGETFDQFYAWGELMLNDFDDIDKHMADAKQVFALLRDIHELDGVEYLSPEQQEALMHFFSNFSLDHNSKLKERFLALWRKFHDIYTVYRQRLLDKGIAYEGMLYRQVAERLKQLMLRGEDDDAIPAGMTLVFVGFNLLNPVEQQFFSFYMKQGQAKFYWDYDDYYMKDEAGKYISQYLKAFPNELPADDGAYSNFTKPKDIAFITAATEDIQARYVSQWLTPERIAAGRRTAIVMANEGMLTTVLHCLPPTVEHVNITTGYPLKQSPASSLVMIAIALMQHNGNYTLHIVNAILHHPYAKFISPKAEDLCQALNSQAIYYPTTGDLHVDDNLTRLFTPLADKTSVNEMVGKLLWLVQTIAIASAQADKEIGSKDDFAAESLYRMYTLLNRIQLLIAEDGIIIEAPLFQKLLQQIIATTTIPFHGEPIEGIQIMGVLETRNLDFDHLLILSCNDGNLPAKVSDSSFIPHTIRKAYELTTIENKVAIYSFYFHRLLQRATDVSISYNNTADLGHTGDMSRFMLQMLAEYPHPIKRLALEAGQNVTSGNRHEVAKTREMVDLILNKKSGLSPSAMGKYLRCPLQFYYKYIANIDDNDTGDEEEMDQRAFGNIFHNAAECLYRPYMGRKLTKDFFNQLLDKADTTIDRLVDDAFRTKLFNITDPHRPTPKLGGLQLINRQMVIRFMRNMLEYDRKMAPLTIVKVEEPLYESITVTLADGSQREMKLGGIADRIDEVTGDNGVPTLRIIDYKTGRERSAKKINEVEDIFNPANIADHSDYYLQAFLYASILEAKKWGLKPIATGLLFVQAAAKKDFDPILKLGDKPVVDISEHTDEYKECLHGLIHEILDETKPFVPTEVKDHCKNCAYAQFCR